MNKPIFKITTSSKGWDNDFSGLATYNDEKVYFYCSHEYLNDLNGEDYPDEVIPIIEQHKLDIQGKSQEELGDMDFWVNRSENYNIYYDYDAGYNIQEIKYYIYRIQDELYKTDHHELIGKFKPSELIIIK